MQGPLASDAEVNRPEFEVRPTGVNIVWPQRGGMLTTPTPQKASVAEEAALPDSPAGEIERILREYACECYAVGRGESMFYLVEDLPRLASAATQEVLAVRPRGIGGRWKTGLGIQTRAASLPPATAFEPVLPRGETSAASLSHSFQATARKGARSVVAVLPVLAVLAALGLTVVLAIAGT